MGAIQTIINLAETIQFDRRNVVGIQYTRSEIPKVSETPTRNAWKINVSVKASMPYNSYRELIEQIDDLDRRKPDTFTFANIPALDWVARYRAQDYGSMTVSLAQQMRVQSFSGDQLVLNNLPNITGAGAVSSSTPLFKAGDFIQLGQGDTQNPYPFTVVNDVLRGTGSTVTLTLHRPVFIPSSNVVGLNISVGSNVYFKMFCTNMPIYTLIPGATQKNSAGKVINNAYIEWSESFKLYEWTGEV
jgi:hypothetical protein